MKTRCRVGIVALLLAVSSAQAATDTALQDGNALPSRCHDAISMDAAAGWTVSVQVAYNAGYCAALVSGTTQMLAALRGVLPQAVVCFPPEGILIRQGVRIAV